MMPKKVLITGKNSKLGDAFEEFIKVTRFRCGMIRFGNRTGVDMM